MSNGPSEGEGVLQREISLGFEKPSELKGDIIYVDFRYSERENCVTTKAISNKEFIYHGCALEGNILIHSEKKATSKTSNVSQSWHIDHREFIDDLVKCNKGHVTYERMIKEGTKKNLLLKKIAALSGGGQLLKLYI